MSSFFFDLTNVKAG